MNVHFKIGIAATVAVLAIACDGNTPSMGTKPTTTAPAVSGIAPGVTPTGTSPSTTPIIPTAGPSQGDSIISQQIADIVNQNYAETGFPANSSPTNIAGTYTATVKDPRFGGAYQVLQTKRLEGTVAGLNVYDMVGGIDGTCLGHGMIYVDNKTGEVLPYEYLGNIIHPGTAFGDLCYFTSKKTLSDGSWVGPLPKTWSSGMDYRRGDNQLLWGPIYKDFVRGQLDSNNESPERLMLRMATEAQKLLRAAFHK